MPKIEITEEQLLAALNITTNYAEIARMLAISPQTVSRRIKEFGLTEYEKNSKSKGCKGRIELSREELLYAQSQTNSALQAAKFLGVSIQTYSRRAKDLGVYKTNQGLKGTHKPKPEWFDKREYKCNDYIFSNLTQEGAYWLGFIASDGYVRENRNCIYFKIQQRDKVQLERLKSFISFEGPIIDRVSKLKVSVEDKELGRIFEEERKYDVSEMTFYSKQIVRDLVNIYDIRQGKTVKETKVFSVIPNEFKLSFICGYFDGDGSVCNYRGKRLRVSICAYGNQILDEFQKWFFEEYKIYSPVYTIHKRDKKTNEIKVYYELHINSLENIKNFSKLYLSKENQLPLMKRKLEIFKTYE